MRNHLSYAGDVEFQKQPYRGVLRKSCSEICSKFTGEHPYRNVISIKLLCNFTEIAFWHRCSPVSLLHIFRTPFAKNTSGGLLLEFEKIKLINHFDNRYSKKIIYRKNKLHKVRGSLKVKLNIRNIQYLLVKLRKL